MGRRPCPFYSVQTMHGQGSCWARVVLPHPNSANPHTIVVYGANEEEAYLKAVMTAITFLSPEEDAAHSDLRYLPTQEMDDEWVRRHDMLKARNDTRPYAACMGFASEMHGMYDRAEGGAVSTFTGTRRCVLEWRSWRVRWLSYSSASRRTSRLQRSRTLRIGSPLSRWRWRRRERAPFPQAALRLREEWW
ncbi:hypothetical protein U9M48_000539 [Paspalum notatum var. saurae]|uniref:Uncharacterized protein n=1 Tax=Paspalum notatum var. saurae TaxID=547442 RepID=A0AAQ3PLN1_PASNO